MSQAKFNASSQKMTALGEKLKKMTNDEQLQLYGLYKVGTVGKVNTDRPGFFDPKGKAKWDAWKAVENISQEEAWAQYVSVANGLLDKYDLSNEKV